MEPSDIVERLRDVADLDARSGEPLGKACREAAAEIERLRAALQDIAFGSWSRPDVDSASANTYAQVVAEMQERAAAAIRARG